MKIQVACVVISLAVSIFVFAAPNQASGPSTDKAAITALGNAWADRFNGHDAKGLANLFTADCVRMPNEGKTTIGRESLADAYAKEFAPVWKTDAKVVITTDEVVLTGNYAFARGSDTTTQTVKDKRTTDIGKWMAVYRREPDRAWKFYWSTYNSNQPANAATH